MQLTDYQYIVYAISIPVSRLFSIHYSETMQWGKSLSWAYPILNVTQVAKPCRSMTLTSVSKKFLLCEFN